MSSILITASDGRLTVWDLWALGERLCSIDLTDATVPLALSAPAGTAVSRHVLLAGSRVVCDYGCLVKTIQMPLPETPRIVLKHH